MRPGYTLDIGCGTGRNLEHLEGHAVGVDPNEAGVAIATAKGYDAFTPDGFARSRFAQPRIFDTVLFAHVLEHLETHDAAALIGRYLPSLRAGGQVIMITPQESGFRSDSTHRTFLDFSALSRLAAACALTPVRSYSFPFPRWAGRAFRYNEFVVVATPS